jgi:histidine triad (HIT) family protein
VTQGDPGQVSGCLFCRIVAGELPADVVHQTDHTVAFRDINPAAPVHVLVVPRQHVENAAAVGAEHAEVVAAMLAAAREVAVAEGIGRPDRGYRLVFNVGPDALNSVPHLHLHVIGGRAMTWPPG